MTSYFFRNWKEISVNDVPEIPSVLLDYDHVNFRNGGCNGPEGWKVLFDEGNQNIEVCRNTMFPLSFLLLSSVFGILFVGVILVLNKFTDITLFQSSMIGLIGLVVVFCMPFGYAFFIWDAMKYWGGPLRMRYTITNGEFFFPREYKTYSRNEYAKIVLGSVGGYKIRENMFELMGQIWRKNSPSFEGGQPPAPMIMHFFVLVLSVDGCWHRHYIENNEPRFFTKSGSATFDKLIELLQPHVDCVVYHRRFSIKECFDQQRAETPELAEPTDKKVLW